ncbi:MAG: hypothetical protein LPK27_05570, partial [Rhodococcus sp. (in: high G+C Gram-positive bacteria)]|nr:hypothetical protein [Rhodococcus sp. (in: high G+C Gram-positive bacteria)]
MSANHGFESRLSSRFTETARAGPDPPYCRADHVVARARPTLEALWMQQRRWTVRSLTAAAAVAAAVAVPAHAVAEPEPPGLPPDALRAAAAAESPEALRAVESLLDAARTPALFEPPPRNTPQPFMQPAPTFGLGCGGGFTPYAMTTGWA